MFVDKTKRCITRLVWS